MDRGGCNIAFPVAITEIQQPRFEKVSEEKIKRKSIFRVQV